MRWKALAAGGSCVLGLVVGLSSVAMHQRWWGFLLAIAATSTTAYALPPGWWARMPFACGWVAMAGFLAFPRPEGDYAIAGDAKGYALLAFAAALAVAAMVTLRPRRGSRPTEESPS